MTVCLLFFFIQTRHWPLVGDAALVHYAVFLFDHGMVPYRQIVDVQMPGIYLIDWLALLIFGDGAIGLRFFDYALLATVIIAMLAISWPRAGSPRSFFADERYAAFLAGGLFALLHGRDGVLQAGQRDLTLTALLLAAYACAFHAVRGHRFWLVGLSAGCAMTAVTIKPTVLPVALALLFLVLRKFYRVRASMARAFLAASAGSMLPLLACAAFLLREHAVVAFLEDLSGLFPYHASLGRRTLGYLLIHSVSPVGIIVVLWVAAVLSRLRLRSLSSLGRDIEWESAALYSGLGLSLLSYVWQAKGFPYQRYPFLAFLLLIVMLEFSRGVRSASRILRWSSAVSIGAAVLFFAPVSAYKIAQFNWHDDDNYRQLSADLNQLGGGNLSGHVQCLDAFSGCIDALDRMRLMQSTGFLADFYFLTPDTTPVVVAIREHFWDELQQNPPRVIVETKQVFPLSASNPDSYDKVKRWPRFNDYLQANYHLVAERTFKRAMHWGGREFFPPGYRIYVRNGDPAGRLALALTPPER